MKKNVLTILGSPRKGQSYRIVQRLSEHLQHQGDIDFQFLHLREADIKPCRGCGLCLHRGEDLCPLKDDREKILALMDQADAVIMATPVYSLQVTALLKNMLDRFAFIFHRPRFFGKIFMPVVTQGVYGADAVVKYLNETAFFWGFKTCPGLALTLSFDNPPPRETAQVEKEIAEAAQRLHHMLINPVEYKPSFKEVLMFRMVRSVHAKAAGFPKDHEYYRDQGWFESEYYCPAKLGWAKRLVGKWADKQGQKTADKIIRERQASEKQE